MRIISKVLYFLAYSVILSLMPILVSLLFARAFDYPFETLDGVADLLITVFCLAATILRDVMESRRMAGRGIVFSMIGICCFSAALFGAIQALTGLGFPLGQETTKFLLLVALSLTAGTTLGGVASQFLESTDSGNPQT